VNPKLNYSERRRVYWQALALLLGLAVLLAEFKFMSGAPLLSDESFNFRQVSRFINRDFSMEPGMNVIPGYHALVSLVLFVFHKSGVFSARFVSFVISVLSIAIFYLLTGKIYPRPSLTRTLQYTFLPILFPFFSLVYTDILALLLVLVALYLVLWKRYTLAGVVGILSVLARTNNIAWLAFLYVFVYYENYGLEWRSFPRSLRQTWIYWLGFGLFLAFLFVNKGIAISDKAVQPLFKFQTGNVFFLLFTFFWLFLPMNIANFPRILRFVRDQNWIVLEIMLIYLVYMFTFSSTHPYNQAFPDYYIRNKLLIAVTNEPGLKSLFFLPIAYALLSLCVTALQEKRFYWLYLFTLLSLVPFWLIEPRYYFVPLSLFILFKNERSSWVEWITVGVFIALSVVLLYYMRSETIFI